MKKSQETLYDLLLILIIAVAAFLRLTGSDWGNLEHQHPDELFITGVVGNLRAHVCMDEVTPIDACPPDQQRWMNFGEYFDTATSTLNPTNRGNAAYVYGTLPIFIVRYTAEIMPMLGDWLLNKPVSDPALLEWAFKLKTVNLKLLGRQFSALADLGTLFLLYLIVKRLYGSRTALLATTFSTFAALQIQQSHFFTTDLFVNLFGFLAIYFAVLILTEKESTKAHDTLSGTSEAQSSGTRSDADFTEENIKEPHDGSSHITHHESRITHHASLIPFNSKFFWLSIAFGIAFGMALASKVNIFPLALLLPGAFIVRGLSDPAEKERLLNPINVNRIITFLIVGGIAAVLTFRILQPYAFDGLLPNQLWMDKIAEQRVQARGDADLPWNLQWARRTHLYSFTNLTVWGLGLPFGILAWVGFLSMAYAMWKGERRHLLLWAWTAFYFLWQSMQFNPTMRYQLPIYPLLAMMAAWFVFEFPRSSVIPSSSSRITHHVSRIMGTIVLVLTVLWGYAFHTIYVRDETRIAASRWIYQNVPAGINLHIDTADSAAFVQPLTFTNGATVFADVPYTTTFVPMQDGILNEISLGYVADATGGVRDLSLVVAHEANPSPEQILARAATTADFSTSDDPRGIPLTLQLDTPLMVKKGEYFTLQLETDGNLAISGAAVINETSYDYGLPFRIDGFDAFAGMYRGDLVLEVYWDDNADKLTRLTSYLDQGDYIFIPTNHQYAQITRLPERYPLTTEYYRQLIGCEGEDIIACYRDAKVGIQGNLSYDLVGVFESYPTIGNFSINDQAAEEAFTFYDHPKVFIFKKSADYDPNQVAAILGAVDLSHVVHLTPKEAAGYEAKDLLLPADVWQEQQAGGTWTELFDPNRLVNKVPVVGMLVWYVFVFILGVFTYPIVRRAFPGLADKGYPLARILGLLLLAYFSWLLGSVGVTYSRLTIALVFLGIVIVGSILFYNEFARSTLLRRSNLPDDETASSEEHPPRRFIDYIKEEWNSNRRYYLMIEGLFLAFFLIDLIIRIANPDLWHPSKGGERPMDLSYLQAILRSTSFPPYDPWFAGGYLNYYYFGFVLVGTPIKLLGLTPTTAYNYLLPTLFALVGIGAFSIGWNLVASRKSQGASSSVKPEEAPLKTDHRILNTENRPLYAGIAASAFMLLLGNLGTIRAIYQGLQRIVDPTAHTADIGIFKHFSFAMQGLWKTITEGALLPIGRGDWYWFPSRVIPAPGDVEPITEFPLFTFLYSDLHAHMIVLPLALLAIAWAVSFLKARVDGKNSLTQIAVEITVASLVVGALRPTNTWDLYAYMPLLSIVIAYALIRYSCTRKDTDNTEEKQKALNPWIQCESVYKNVFLAIGGVALFVILSSLLYLPYIANFGQAYGKINAWKGTHTPLGSYFAQWGLLLFVIVSWMWSETYMWMARTPYSALAKWRGQMQGVFVLLLGLLIGLASLGVKIGWITVPLLLWAGLLILRPELDERKRLVLFLVGTGLLLTTVVEVIVLAGDIGRMNTVFKLYLQAWTFFAISAGASLIWLLPELKKWTLRWQTFWQTVLGMLVLGAMLFTVTATLDKMRDRVDIAAPLGLDGMAYMKSAPYWDGVDMDLNQDYAGIQWMRENIVGSPVIIEANTPEYRWGSRYTIYTGLPGVVGWNWHQRQQRALNPTVVTDRVAEVGTFYNTIDLHETQLFLQKYNVRYIVVGQVEKQYYTPEGLAKFAAYNGALWDEVFRDRETVIYAVR